MAVYRIGSLADWSQWGKQVAHPILNDADRGFRRVRFSVIADLPVYLFRSESPPAAAVTPTVTWPVGADIFPLGITGNNSAGNGSPFEIEFSITKDCFVWWTDAQAKFLPVVWVKWSELYETAPAIFDSETPSVATLEPMVSAVPPEFVRLERMLLERQAATDRRLSEQRNILARRMSDLDRREKLLAAQAKQKAIEPRE